MVRTSVQESWFTINQYAVHSAAALLQADVVQIKDTFDVDDSRRSYFSSLFPLNPGGIIPAGPTLQDLRLDDDPKRGPHHVDQIFHKRAQLALAA